MSTGIRLNTILYGPPGTGKTYNSIIYAVAICSGQSIENVKKERYADVLEEFNRLKDDNRITFTTFHQSYGYEDFIEGIKPQINNNEALKYMIEDGAFKRFCDNAKEDSSKPYVFIIDEINRGNISKIFGELITLIEENKRDGAAETLKAKLPYSKMEFSVPRNVYILGTMNTADRSIALMDTALRRRFDFIEVLPDTSVLESLGIGIIPVGDEELDVSGLLNTINKRIEYLYDREHTIGHSYFTKLADDNPSIDILSDIFEKNVIPLLQEYFYDDYEKIQFVLGDNAKKDDRFKFILDSQVKLENEFVGNPNIDDLPNKCFSIQHDAFKILDSYKQIVGDHNDEGAT